MGVLRELVLDGYGGPPAGGTPVGLMRGRTTPELIDAAVRLLRLLDAPADAAPLAPLAEREILYRLLTGPTAGMMRHIASADSHLSQISRAIAWLRDHYRDVFTVEDLARKIGMSPSAFHLHFKAVTTMSPLQFRNALRLAVGAPDDGRRRSRRGDGGLRSRLSEPVAVQPRLRPLLRRIAAARHPSPAPGS